MFILNLLFTFVLIILGFKLVGLFLRWFIAYKLQKAFGKAFNQQNRGFQGEAGSQKGNANGDAQANQYRDQEETTWNQAENTGDLPMMVKCKTCGLFLAQSEAIKRGVHYYCQQDHVK